MKLRLERPSWWVGSAVPYRFFWLLPSAGAIAGYGAVGRLGVPLWLGLVVGELPALALEAWWRRQRPAAAR